MAYEDIKFSGAGVGKSEERGYSKTQRGHVSDFASEVYRSIGSAMESTGRGLEAFTGGSVGSSIRGFGDTILKSTYALPDVDEYLGEEGTIKNFARDVVGTVTESFVGTGTAAMLGTLATGSPLVGAAAGTAQLITQFGGGTYSRSIDEGKKAGLSGEELHSYAKKQALWEVIPELGDQAVTALTMGLWGVASKSLGAGRKVLQNAIKSGKITPNQLIKEMAKVDGALAKIGTGAAMGGSSEVVTSLGQGSVKDEYGVEKGQENLGYTWLLGATASGGPTSIGQAHLKMNEGKRAERIRGDLNSSDVNVRSENAKHIFNMLGEEDQALAQDWATYSQHKINVGEPIELSREVDTLINRQGIGWKPVLELEGRAPNDVLSKELAIAEASKVAEPVDEATPLEMGIKKVQDTGARAEEVEGAYEYGGYNPTPPKVYPDPLTPKQEMEARADEAMLRTTVEPGMDEAMIAEDIRDPENIYEAASGQVAERLGLSAALDNITPQQKQVLKDAAKDFDVKELFDTVDDGTKQVLLDASASVQSAKEVVNTAGSIEDKVTAIKDVKKKQKDLETILEYSREEFGIGNLIEGMSRAKEELGSTVDKATKKATDQAKADKDKKAGIITDKVKTKGAWKELHLENGAKIFKESANSYLVQEEGKTGSIRYTTLGTAIEDAEAGTVEGRAGDTSGKKTVSEKREGEKRGRDVSNAEKGETEQWLFNNDYYTEVLDEDGNFVKYSPRKSGKYKNMPKDDYDGLFHIALARLVQSKKPLTKANLNAMMVSEERADRNVKERDVKQESAEVVVDGASIAKKGSEGAVVLPDDDQATTEAIEPTDVGVKRTFQGSPLTMNLGGSVYTIEDKVDGNKVTSHLLKDGELLEVYPDNVSAANSMKANIFGKESGEYVTSDLRKMEDKPKKEKELGNSLSDIDPYKVRGEAQEASKKRGKTVVRRRKGKKDVTSSIKKEERGKEGESSKPIKKDTPPARRGRVPSTSREEAPTKVKHIDASALANKAEERKAELLLSKRMNVPEGAPIPEGVVESMPDTKVSEGGKPKRVYRGISFNEKYHQEIGRDSLFFAEEPGTAGTYGTVGSYFIDIQNPLEVDFKGRAWGQRAGSHTSKSWLDTVTKVEDLFPHAKSQGKDGIIVKNIVDGGGKTTTTYVIWDKSQMVREVPYSEKEVEVLQKQLSAAKEVGLEGQVPILSSEVDSKLESLDIETEVTFGTETVTLTENAKDTLEYLNNKQKQLDDLAKCIGG